MDPVQELLEEFITRPYQVLLYEKSLLGNVIVYFSTGTGKTYIAVLLIKHLSYSTLMYV